MAFHQEKTDDTSRDAAANQAPTQDWKAIFERRKVPPKEVRELVAQLNAAGKSEDVIALLEQAIIQGQIQPWMYEVLALTMEAVGRPRAQVERVILSSLDFVNDDADAMLLLAAYLTKFERYQQSLRLYRRVATVDPLRAESYVMGLGLAEKLEDPVAAMWVVPGVLTRAWGQDGPALRERAERLSEKIAAQLKESGRPLEAAALEQLTSSARQRDLLVTLEWNGNGDIDLEIVDPTNAVCTARQPATGSGLLHIRSGQGPRQDDCREEIVAPLALSGEYRVRVRHVSGDIVGKRARLTVIRYAGSPRELRQVQTIPLDNNAQIVRVLLKSGRLSEPVAVPAAPVSTSLKARGHRRANIHGLPDGSPHGGRPNADGAVTSNVGFQPVVAFVPSGAQLTALAVVSGDRRYVRISASPLFTTITDVFTFSFAGSTGNGNF